MFHFLHTLYFIYNFAWVIGLTGQLNNVLGLSG